MIYSEIFLILYFSLAVTSEEFEMARTTLELPNEEETIDSIQRKIKYILKQYIISTFTTIAVTMIVLVRK